MIGARKKVAKRYRFENALVVFTCRIDWLAIRMRAFHKWIQPLLANSDLGCVLFFRVNFLTEMRLTSMGILLSGREDNGWAHIVIRSFTLRNA